MHPSCGHALVRGFDHYADPERLEDDVKTLCNLGGHFFLDLEALRVDINQAHELGDADDPGARMVADVDATDDRRDVMLAMGFKPDVAHQHNLIIARDLLEGSPQIFLRILEITRKPFLVCAHDA